MLVTSSIGKNQFALSLDPETARSMHDENASRRVLQTCGVLFHVRAEVLFDELFDQGGTSTTRKSTDWKKKDYSDLVEKVCHHQVGSNVPLKLIT